MSHSDTCALIREAEELAADADRLAEQYRELWPNQVREAPAGSRLLWSMTSRVIVVLVVAVLAEIAVHAATGWWPLDAAAAGVRLVAGL